VFVATDLEVALGISDTSSDDIPPSIASTDDYSVAVMARQADGRLCRTPTSVEFRVDPPAAEPSRLACTTSAATGQCSVTIERSASLTPWLHVLMWDAASAG
jgi:hypothetical protein